MNARDQQVQGGRRGGSWGRTWLTLFGAFTLFLAFQLNLAAVVRFTADNASAVGTVVALTPEIHNTFQVEYFVDGARLTMASNDEGGASVHQIGDRVTVFYARDDPAVASLKTPPRVLGDATFFLALFAVLGATWFTFIVQWWRRSRMWGRGG